MDRGWIPGKVQGLFSKTATKGYVLFLALRSRSDGSQRIRGTRRRPADRLSAPARWCGMGAAARLAGVLGSLAPMRQNSSQAHGDKEEREASSPKGLSRAANKLIDRVAVEIGRGHGEIQKLEVWVARARSR